jgi:hypothetical protein
MVWRRYKWYMKIKNFKIYDKALEIGLYLKQYTFVQKVEDQKLNE